MKTENTSPVRAENAQAQSRQAHARKPGDAPADLFAQLLLASTDALETVETEAPALTQPEVPFLAALTPTLPTISNSEATTENGDFPIEVFSPPMDLKHSDLEAETHNPLKKTEAPQETGGPLTDDTRFGPGAWVSTVAKARTKTAPPPQQLTQMMEATGGLSARPVSDATTQAWHMSVAGQPGQLLAQNLAASETTTQVANTLGESAPAAGEQRGGQQQPSQGEPGRVILEAPGANKTQATTDSATPKPFAASLGEAMGESFESLGAQVSVWAASNTRRASMRLEAGLKEALEVEVTLDDGKTHLAFRTDDPQAREAIKAHAQQVLSELLAKAGLSLQGMSVDARDAQQSSGDNSDRPGRRNGLRQAIDSVGAAPADATRLQVTTARPGLSVYA